VRRLITIVALLAVAGVGLAMPATAKTMVSISTAWCSLKIGQPSSKAVAKLGKRHGHEALGLALVLVISPGVTKVKQWDLPSGKLGRAPELLVGSGSGRILYLWAYADTTKTANGAHGLSCKAFRGAGSSTTPVATPTPVPTPSVGDQLLAADNQENSVYNANLASVNSGVPATVTAGWNAIDQGQQAFDTTIEGINFPKADAVAVNGVLAADTAYENAIGTLAVNTDDTDNYNALFDAMLPLESAFDSAQATLGDDFGLTSATPTP
jgi:hypothetical protein